MKAKNPIYILEGKQNIPEWAKKTKTLKTIKKYIHTHGRLNEAYIVHEIDEGTGIIWRTFELFYAMNETIYIRKVYDKDIENKKKAKQMQQLLNL